MWYGLPKMSIKFEVSVRLRRLKLAAAQRRAATSYGRELLSNGLQILTDTQACQPTVRRVLVQSSSSRFAVAQWQQGHVESKSAVVYRLALC